LRSLGQGKGNKEEQSEAPNQGLLGQGLLKTEGLRLNQDRTPFTEM